MSGYCIGGPHHGRFVMAGNHSLVIFPRLIHGFPIDPVGTPIVVIEDLYQYAETDDGQGWWLHV